MRIEHGVPTNCPAPGKWIAAGAKSHVVDVNNMVEVPTNRLFPIHMRDDVYRNNPLSIHVDAFEGLTESGFLHKQKIGRSNYYINIALNAILTGGRAGQID